MKSYQVVWPAARKTAIEEMEVPEPGPGQIQVETAYSAISPGTERGRYIDIRGDLSFPFVPGYSISGHVMALGEGVEGFKVGDPVCAWATHSAHVVVPVARVIPIPEGVDLESAAFFHLGFVSLHGARRSQIEVGESVAIVGQGLLGLLALRMARLQGAVPVIALDLDDSRLKRSLAFGADVAVNPRNREELQRVLSDLYGGGPAVVIEVSGAQTPINMAIEIVRRLGRVTLLGSMQQGGELPDDIFLKVHRKGVTVIGAQTVARPINESRPGIWTWQDDGATFLRLIQRGRIDMQSLITHRAPAREAGRLFDINASGDPSLIGAVFQWQP